jgi:predicted dehydrogenase/threonine dehydrogenase-like Zn-dependent dehydrogenase
MKQVIQNFKTGELYVDDIPAPAIAEGMVLVENKYSLISAGTERGTTKVAQASLLGKAKQRPDLVKQVLNNIKKEGLAATIEKVRTKLDSLKALGYSTAGVVAASMDTESVFRPGDRVACAGAGYASHAEVVAVPQNLVVKIPDNVSFEEASFVTLGAIALQGVRQAEVQLGDNVCVIGLGLLGQLTCQLLKSNGCNVFGIDVSKRMVDLALETKAADQALNRNDPNLLVASESFTRGFGFDSVIITAAAPTNNDPVELSSEILRKKGKVVVVGAVKMDIPRDPHFYRKELELRMSCSYGPGRYDYNYEEKGEDYPYAYVRWTEQRNMEAFLRLISNGGVNLKTLTTHIFQIADAEKAYDLVMGKTDEPSIGILLKYNYDSLLEAKQIRVNDFPRRELNVAFIGAGSFAQSYLIPNVKSFGGSLDTVVTSTGINAKNVASKFGFNEASTDAEAVLKDDKVNTIFIATRHNSHAEYVLKALKTSKSIFVEKPLAMSVEELEDIRQEYEKQNSSRLLVGFNRRFAPSAVKAKSIFKGVGEPLVINYRVNAGFIPRDHWSQDEKIGGGRVIGEVCHFVDLMQFLTDATPEYIYADCINFSSDKIVNEDNISVTIRFSNGSIGNLIYVANGDKALAKERIEISAGGKSVVIDDFKKITIYSNNKSTSDSLVGKGHKEEVIAFLNAIKTGNPSPISFESIYATTLATFKILDCLSTGLPQKIENSK